jgi:hypothetical protein
MVNFLTSKGTISFARNAVLLGDETYGWLVSIDIDSGEVAMNSLSDLSPGILLAQNTVPL